MIFADKLIELRKKSGWSQEELAEQLSVSRQSVSKWEGAQSIPDMNKLIKMSELFSVSLDTLIKEELPLEKETLVEETAAENIRLVSMEEARAFLDARLPLAPKVALGVVLCILSPVLLLLLNAYSEMSGAFLSENQAAGIGMIVLLLMVASAVAIFMMVGNRLHSFAYLDREVIDTAYGVSGMVKEEMEKYRDTYNRCNTIGVLLCICAAIPLFLMGFMGSEADLAAMAMLCITLLMVSAAVYLFVNVGSRWGSYQRLLQEGEYSVKKKTGSKVPGVVTSIYWVLATTIFLVIAFTKGTWGFAGVFWSVAGVSFVPVILITNLLCEKKK